MAVCRLRDHFSDTALAIPTGGGYVFFKFLYATQSPLSAYFALLEEQEQPADTSVITGANWEQVAMSKAHRTSCSTTLVVVVVAR